MKLIFVGLMYNPHEKSAIREKTISGFQEPADTFQWSFVNGLLKNEYFDKIKIINVVPTGTYPNKYKEVFTKSKTWSYLNNSCFQIGSINLPFIKQIQRYIALRKQVACELANSDENTQIIFYSLYPLFISLAKFIKKAKYNASISIIVPDLPSKFGIMPNGLVGKLFSQLEGIFVLKRMKYFDHFVLLTEQMLNPLSITHKSHVVIEGLLDTELTTIELEFANKNIKSILYSGSLNCEFGVCDLISAFELIDDRSIELWICGSGDCEDFVKNISNSDKRIKYFGQLDRIDLIALQSKAYLLVNPRNNEGEYVKYSFPSKTMEYIYSGKPTIMHRLSCIPKEYNNHLYFFENSSIESIMNGIIELLRIEPSRYIEEGIKNRKWIIENKLSDKQTMKFIDLIRSGNQE
ncbi:MAG TPA: hypothetical protein DIC19_05795 [Erysipelotrichaceae bacterium]|nr:hypothetical protein [Erysipelotrichaceae bacterium]